jgi:pyruvate, water dikinase
VVSGLVVPDVYRLSRAGCLIAEVPGVKAIAIRAQPEGATAEEAVEAGLVHVSCLDAPRLRRLNAIATECEGLFGDDLDIEWAWAADRPYLLQCRPITTTALGAH